MTQTNRFALMLEALTELAQEEQAPHAGPRPGLPSLRSIITEISPLPREALFLGLAEDGLPVLLNLYDPLPGPLLITGDQASGKTALLKLIARAAEIMHSPSEVEYGVITNHAEEWDDFKDSQNETGIYSIREDTTQDFLHSLVSWAHNNKGEKSSVLLLIDNLEPAARLNLEAEQNLRWLLLRGPSRRVWPIVTLNAGRARTLEAWLGFFRTRLFGCIRDPSDSQFVTGISDELLDDLDPGSQFTMREGDHWLNFRIPNSE